MIQPNNRHISISLYLTVLAVAETIILILGGYFGCVNVRASCLGLDYNQVLVQLWRRHEAGSYILGCLLMVYAFDILFIIFHRKVTDFSHAQVKAILVVTKTT